MSREFEGQVAVVTGASRGIGHVLTRMFAEAGARVVFSARSAAPLQALQDELRAEGHDVLAVAADVGRHADCERLIQAAVDRWGRIDFLINNAALSGVQKPIHELSYEEFDEVVKADTYSVYSCTHFAARHMVAQRRGVIVNVSSGAARRPYANRTPYVAAKRALTGITCTTALDLGPYGIRCNTVSPGPVEGARLDEVVARASKARGLPEDVIARKFRDNAAMRAYVTNEDCCHTILFLCSERARHVTGQDIGVNAGSLVL